MARRGPAAAARAAMPQRYGPQRRWTSRVVIGAGALVTVAGLVWLVWAASTHATPDVSAGVTGYEVVSSSRTDITVEVHRRVGGQVRCDVYAQAADTTIVGERRVLLDAGGPGTVTTTITIATERRATTALLRECVLA